VGPSFAGAVNLLKGAIVTADMITAVSPTYA
jgi:glycogen synthase